MAMTRKEFERIIDEVYGLDFWGYEGVLLMLACYEDKQSKELARNGLNIISDKAFERYTILHNELDKIGYYDD